MPPIGETLREARMRQKLDIADVEERTKIRAKYLRALENEEWSSLPGPTFVKTFLRTYAEVVGVDPHLLVEEFRSQHERPEEAELQPVAVARARRRRGRDRGPARPPGPPSRLAIIAGLVVAIVALLAVIGLLSGDEDGGSPDEGSQAAETTQATAPERPARRPRPRPAPPAAVTVRIAPTVPTYACIDTGEGTETVFEGTLDSARTFRNPRELRLNLGKRSLELRANGKVVEVPQSPEPFGLQVTRNATKEIAEGARPCA